VRLYTHRSERAQYQCLDPRPKAEKHYAGRNLLLVMLVAPPTLTPEPRSVFTLRELDLRLVETVCVASYHGHTSQGDLKVLKSIAPSVLAISNGRGKGVLPIDGPHRHRQDRQNRARYAAGGTFRPRLCQAGGCADVPAQLNLTQRRQSKPFQAHSAQERPGIGRDRSRRSGAVAV